MEDLDIKSYRLLKKISNCKEFKQYQQNREFDCIRKAGYLERNIALVNLEEKKEPFMYKINDKGLTYIINRDLADRRWWTPILISCGAVLISIASLLVAILK